MAVKWLAQYIVLREPMNAAWRERADRFWASELGVDAGSFASSGFHVLQGDDDGGDPRVICVGTERRTLVSVPRGRREGFETAGFDFTEMAGAPRATVSAYGRRASLDVRGPAYLGYWSRSSVPRPSRAVSTLDATRDRAALTGVRDSAPAEWDEAGFEASSILLGARDGETLVAVAGYARWADVAQLHVFCHPSHRGRGLAIAVLAAAISDALAGGFLPQYRARDTNVASRALATRCGFEEYGWMATIRVSRPPAAT